MKNTLYYGDNLDILKRHISDESIDLIYLDPPFKSGKNYNIIFKPELGEFKGATAQTHTFEDTWQWGQEAEKEYQGLITGDITKERPNQKVIDLIKSMRGYLKECSLMAYLCMMAPRLLEMRRVLKKTGSIYLHCDPTASHYLKLLMDAVFGEGNFINEIVWCKKTTMYQSKTRFVPQHDIILFYRNGGQYKFNWEDVAEPFSEETVKKYRHADANGKRFRLHGRNIKGSPIKNATDIHISWLEKAPDLVRVDYLDDKAGVKPKDWWVIDILNQAAKERLGYPTQKPETLLEKIIKASSNEGDLVLDPFCGCGTTIAVAERLKRNWIGIDITYLAIDVIKKRFESNAIKEGIDFEVDGEPTDVYSAEKLAKKDPFQFQLWCISKIDATPSQTKSGDQGVDGIINFINPIKENKAGKGIIQVKGTQIVTPSMVRDLKGTMKSQNADFSVLITLKKPTRGMTTEGVKEGRLQYMTKEIPKIQLLTVEDLFKDPIPIVLPGNILPPYKKPIIKKGEQKELF